MTPKDFPTGGSVTSRHTVSVIQKPLHLHSTSKQLFRVAVCIIIWNFEAPWDVSASGFVHILVIGFWLDSFTAAGCSSSSTPQEAGHGRLTAWSRYCPPVSSIAKGAIFP